ncbi:hypothetical protein FRX31_009912, partial [Thalictrum thalictroides]
GYQRVGENVTKGKPDMHEAIDARKFTQDATYAVWGGGALDSVSHQITLF